MVLVDTSLWVSHLRKANPHLQKLLVDGEVLCHPFIIGEMACGNIRNRVEMISLLHALPIAQIVQEDELLQFIENKKIYGLGIGLVDAHLLASAFLTRAPLWTTDKNLRKVAEKLKVSTNFNANTV